MDPVLFEIGGFAVYSYGALIAVGAIAGVSYMAVEGRKEAGLTFDQANSLFLIIFFAAFAGGKIFLFFEDPATYLKEPSRLLTGRGFVFYGSFLLAVPAMLWYFRKQNLHPYKMLDVMAVTTCLVHIFGRMGCFFAGCCHGNPTDSFLAVTFSDPACYADPLNTPLHPTQLYEASFILGVMLILLRMKNRRRFYGQMFLSYLILYGAGRFFLEFLRGDEARGFVTGTYLSHSQFIALLVIAGSLVAYSLRARASQKQ